jgi:hypothetical protein
MESYKLNKNKLKENKENLKQKIREKMSSIFARILKNVVGKSSTGDNSIFLNKMMNKKKKFKEFFKNDNTNNTLKTAYSILEELNLKENKSKNILFLEKKYNEIINIFKKNKQEKTEKNIEKNMKFNGDDMEWSEEYLKKMKKFENNLKESFKSEYKEPKINNLNFIKKNNTNNLNSLKDCSLIIKDKDINNLNNGEEVDIIYNIYPEIKQWIKTFPENKKSLENFLKIGMAIKKYNKLSIYIDSNDITFDRIPKIYTISDTFFDKILKNISDYKKAV